MATDLTVILRNVPGTIADLGEAAGKAGLNLRGACGFESGGEGVMHVLVEGDASTARQAFEDGGMEVRNEREVLVVDVEDTPGGLGRTMRQFADAGVNVDLVYLTVNGRLVIGPDDVERARSVASGSRPAPHDEGSTAVTTPMGDWPLRGAGGPRKGRARTRHFAERSVPTMTERGTLLRHDV